MSKFAPARDDGLKPYVVASTCWGRTANRIEWAESLAEAKRQYGWTRASYTTISVRRATHEDV